MARILRGAWVRVTRSGSDELADPGAAKYVILLNSLAVVAACLSLAFLPMLASFLPASRPFLYLTIALALASSLIPLLNHLGLRRFARAFFTLHAVAAFTFLAMLRGPQQNFHLYLLLPVIVAMFIHPPDDARQRNVIVALTLAGFVGLEVWFPGHEPLLPADNASLSATGKIALDTGLVVFVGGFALHIYRAYIRAENRAESLLRNILPEKTANALKLGQPVPAERLDDATVVFLDIAGFTAYSNSIEPEALVAVLDECFSLLDDLADRHGLEKIKTIGDSYMAAAGIPEPRSDHAVAAAEFALDVRGELAAMFSRLSVPLDFRIGINSGPVVAGVIGKKKFIYDLWGDTVNTASRMESHGIAGKIQVGPRTHELLRNQYDFEIRQPTEVRGKGVMELYLLRGRLCTARQADGVDQRRLDSWRPQP